MANRDPESAHEFSASELSALADEFDRYAAKLREAAEIAKPNGLATFNAKSGHLAKDRGKAFCDAIDDAIFQVKVGRPYTHGQLKPRSVAHKSKDKDSKHLSVGQANSLVDVVGKAVKKTARKKRSG